MRRPLKKTGISTDTRYMCVVENLDEVRARSLHLEGFVSFPWRGSQYGNGDLQARVLVLGVSTYMAHQDESREQYSVLGPHWFNHGVYNGYYANRWSDSFWTKWLASLLNRQPATADRQAVLDQVAFYNYLDVILSAPREAVSPEIVAPARKKFQRALDELAPDLILNLSYEQFDWWLPSGGFESAPDITVPVGHAPSGSTTREKRFTTGFYVGERYKSLILRLPHPSTSAWCNAEVWPAVQEALRRSKERSTGL